MQPFTHQAFPPEPANCKFPNCSGIYRCQCKPKDEIITKVSDARIAEIREYVQACIYDGVCSVIKTSEALDLLAALDAANERVKYAETAAVVARDYLDIAKARALAAEAERDRMKAALEPLAALAGAYDPVDEDDDDILWDRSQMPTVGMIRAARAALAQEPS
jgi:hypothetical protein